MRCIFSGFPRPELTWNRNLTISKSIEIITVNERIDINTSVYAQPLDNQGQYSILSQLTIFNLIGNDEGYYECSAKESIFGTTNSSKSFLTIQSMCTKLDLFLNYFLSFIVPPTITPSSSYITVAEGNKVILSFNISGAKPSVIPDQVMWSFTNLAGQHYDININERYNFSIDKSKLILMDTHRTDRGNYSIIINHNTGQYSSSIELFIKGKTLNLILLSLLILVMK